MQLKIVIRIALKREFERNELLEWNGHMRYLLFFQSLKQIKSINTDFYIIEP